VRQIAASPSISPLLTLVTVGFRTESLALIADAFHYVYRTRPMIYDAAD
jgi:hypothetical protein